ncbi:ENR1 protein, partial [Cinclus mexicanus]|nr:ENR1 protein [Cinclus mexicanus]
SEILYWVNQTNANPFEEVSDLKEYWDNPGKVDERWKAPDGLFWICGNRGYSELGKKWKGTYTIGVIQPAVFLLPRWKGSQLGKPL